ncbi:MAG: outer membrane beta-barrel family protein [Chitinophagaceae bacterium]|nr:outer membrane beta-barrel family protein [Chitinophagaceae bacterium]
MILKNTYSNTNAGLKVRTQKKKFSYALGLSWQRASLDGKVLSGIKDTVIGKSFTNLLPNANFVYSFTRYKRFTMNYMANTNQPTVSQLQPIPDISNPLAIREGNPDLDQEVTHRVQLNYSGINPFRNRNLFVFLNLMRTDNKIVNSDSLFSNGVRKTRPVNTDGVYNLTGDINLGLPARFLKGTFEVGTNLSYMQGRQFMNGDANNIKNYSIGPRVRAEMNPTEKLNISLSLGGNINFARYSLQPDFNTRFFLAGL